MVSIFTFFVLQLLAVIYGSANEANQDSNIYGVRWFLAQSFRYKQLDNAQTVNNTTVSDLIGMFNAHKHTLGIKYHISIEGMVFPCQMKQVNYEITENFHSNYNNLSSKIGQSFTTFVYRCPVRFMQQNYLQSHNFFQYKIWSQVQTEKKQFFKSTLKSPMFKHRDLKAVVLGDWGQISKESEQYIELATIDQCLSNKIKNDEVNLMILLGDLGYDLQGLTYINFLTYLQNFSKNIAILFTPGNHQSAKHINIYQLTKETFYSPFWSDYYGYFQLINIGKYLFLGYSPDSQFYPSLYNQLFLQKQGRHPIFMERKFTEYSIADIYANYTTIAFSHFPIFCSEQNEYDFCSSYQQKQQPYLKILKKLGIDLMFSAHLHFYQRSKPICYNENDYLDQNSTDEKDIYELKSCPVFVIDGAAGNNYYVMTEPVFQLKNFSKKFVGNTGFGLLTLYTQSQFSKIQFKQISAKRQCRIEDHFIMKSRFDQDNVKQTGFFFFLVIGSVGVSLIVFIGYLWRSFKNSKCKISRNHRSHSMEKIGFNWELQELSN